MSNYIPLNYMDVITYQGSNPNAALANLSQYKKSQVGNYINPELIWSNINIYLHITSKPEIISMNAVEIYNQGRRSISYLLMAWRHKEPGHQQVWYQPIPHNKILLPV